jgi:hypothetical protein
MQPTIDPFRATVTPNPTHAACPKCGWRQAPSTTCEACGLIFARYQAAQRKTTAAVPLPRLSPSALEPVEVHAPPPPRRTSSTATEIVSRSISASMATLFAVLGINLLPMAVMGAVGAAGATLMVPLMKLAADVGTVGAVLLAIGVVVLAIRLGGTVSAATMILVDDQMERGEHRGVMASFSEGWTAGGRMLPLGVLTWLIMFLPTVPVLVLLDNAAGAVLSVAWMLASSVVCSLAMPAAVLGDRSVVGALQEAWQLSKQRVGFTLKTTALATCAVMVAAGVAVLALIVPIAGWAFAAVVFACLGGFSMAVVAGLWRELSGDLG